MVCATCKSELQEGARFCSACGQRVYEPNSQAQQAYVPVHEAAAQAGLVRPREGRMIAGVCAGFARRYGWDVTIVRLVVALSVLVGCGTPFLAYVIAWIVMPNESYFISKRPVVPTVSSPEGQPQV